MHNGRNYLVEQHIFRALSTFSSVVDTRPNKIMVGPVSVRFGLGQKKRQWDWSERSYKKRQQQLDTHLSSPL